MTGRLFWGGDFSGLVGVDEQGDRGGGGDFQGGLGPVAIESGVDELVDAGANSGSSLSF